MSTGSLCEIIYSCAAMSKPCPCKEPNSAIQGSSLPTQSPAGQWKGRLLILQSIAFQLRNRKKS